MASAVSSGGFNSLNKLSNKDKVSSTDGATSEMEFIGKPISLRLS